MSALARLKRAVLQDYSYRDLRPVKWDKQFAQLSATLRRISTGEQFASEAAKTLEPAKDLHFWLHVNGCQVPTFIRHAKRNVSFKTLARLVPGWRDHNAVVATGLFPNGIRYLSIRAWPAGGDRKLGPAYSCLREAQAAGSSLIIDVRANGGGSEPLAARFAGCFVRHPVCYAKHLKRAAGKFFGPVERWLKPNRRRAHYTGRVAVLIGPGTVSSCESFVLMMRQVPGCKLIGEPTAGASGNPLPVDLGNGVVAYVPSWADLEPDGTCFEGRGIAPDILVGWKTGVNGGRDPVLAAAVQFLRRKKQHLFSDAACLN